MPTSTTTWRAGWRSCLIKLVLDEDGECDDDDYMSITPKGAHIVEPKLLPSYFGSSAVVLRSARASGNTSGC